MDNPSTTTYNVPPVVQTPRGKYTSVFILVALVVVIGAAVSWWYVSSHKSGGEVSNGVTYRNEQYGFEVKLPESWQGFTTRESQKEIYDVSPTGGNKIIGHFPLVEIVHPLSTTAAPRQTIPIFVFTQVQWAHIGDDSTAADWSVSAAPIPPSALGRNSTYVFALPARYNYAFLSGWEEVQQIIDSHPLPTFEPSATISAADSSDWKTYRNEKYRFEVMFPPSWIASADTDFIVIEAATSTSEHPSISIQIIENSRHRPLSEIEEFMRINFEKECETIAIGNNTAFDCYPAITFAGERIIVISKVDIVISIGDSIGSDVSHKIISSFKFTK